MIQDFDRRTMAQMELALDRVCGNTPLWRTTLRSETSGSGHSAMCEKRKHKVGRSKGSW
jgi:hypothetical protein